VRLSERQLTVPPLAATNDGFSPVDLTCPERLRAALWLLLLLYYYYTGILLWCHCHTAAAGPPYKVPSHALSNMAITHNYSYWYWGHARPVGYNHSIWNDDLNRKVLSSRWKAIITEVFWTDGGREFQALAAATGNAQSSSIKQRVDKRVELTCRQTRGDVAEHSWRLAGWSLHETAVPYVTSHLRSANTSALLVHLHAVKIHDYNLTLTNWLTCNIMPSVNTRLGGQSKYKLTSHACVV